MSIGADPFGIGGQVAIVTGGGTGIGAATAHLLASYGAIPVIGSRKVDNLEQVAADIRADTGQAVLAVEADVRDEDSCAHLVDQTLSELGRVDILVNNAGGSYMFPFLQTPVDRYDNNVSLNLRGPYVLIQAVAPPMIAQGGGSIINISSGAGVQGVVGGAVYSAAKAGLQ